MFSIKFIIFQCLQYFETSFNHYFMIRTKHDQWTLKGSSYFSNFKMACVFWGSIRKNDIRKIVLLLDTVNRSEFYITVSNLSYFSTHRGPMIFLI